MALDKSSKIFVAGNNGLVGSAIWNNLLQRGHKPFMSQPQRAGLTDQYAVMKFFDEEQPDTVVLAAVFVGVIRPVEGVTDGANKDEILKVLAKYGIEDNKVTLWGTGTPPSCAQTTSIWQVFRIVDIL